MPRRRGYRGRKAEPDGQIKELVGAIIKYKNFKQLAEYNMSCLLQKITPPTAGWEDAVKEVVAQDGLETIVDVLKKQKGNASILATASKTLCRLAINPSVSNKLAASGGIGAALASLEFMGDDDDENSADALENTVVLLEQVAASAPEAVVSSGALENVLNVMQKQGVANQICMEACVRTLERCSRTNAGLGEIVQKNGVPVLLGTFRDTNTSSGTTMSGLKLMDRVCRLEQYIDYVNQCGGIETMVTLLSNQSENTQVVKQGGRLLSKIAKSQLSETMAKLNNSNLDPAVKMTTLNLLSSLALEDESAERIVADGGIGTLIADLADEDIDETMIIAESKFLGRLMTSNKNVSEMIQNGGVDTVIGLADRSTGNEAVMESLIPALVQMVSVSEYPSSIVSQSGVTGVKVVIDTITNNPNFIESTEAGIKLISKMATSKKTDNKPQLIQDGAIVAVSRALAACPDSEDVQVSGISAIGALASEPSYGQYIVDTGVIPSVLASLESFEDNREVTMGAFSLLSKLTELGNSGQEATVQMLRTPEAKETIMNAINMYSGDVAMRTISANIINQIAGPSDIAQAKSDMKAAVAEIGSDESGDAAARARKALQSLSAFAIAPHTGMMVMEDDGLQSFVECLRTVAVQQEAPGQEAIISLSTASINALLQNTATKDAVVSQCDNGKLIKAISTSIKMNPTVEPTNSMRLMRTIAAERTLAPVLISNGGVEAVVACVRGNQENPEAVAHGVEVLQRIAAQGPDGIQKVVRKGGVRLVSKLLDNNDSAFDKTRVPMLELLKHLASSSSAREIMMKQGVKDAVVKVMAANPTHVEIQSLGGHIIRDCTTEKDLYGCAELLVQQANQKSSVETDALLGNLGTISSMAQAGDSARKLVESGSAQTMVAVLADAATWEDEDSRRDVVNATALALGSIASKVPLPESTQAVPWLLHALKITESPDVVDALTAVAQTKANVDSLVTGGGVETIVAILQKHEHDKIVSTACYQALAMIARGGPAAVGKISQAGGLVLAKNFLENGTETASPAQIQYATELMSELCSVESTAAWIEQQGGVEAVFDIVDHQCVLDEPNMAIVSAGISMLGNSARTASVASSIAKKGDMRRLLASVQDKAQLREDPKAMKALMVLLQNEIAMAPESVEMMMSCDVGDLVMETMATHASDAAIGEVSAVVLKSVISVEQASDMVTVSQDKVNQMLAQVSPAQSNPTVLASISDTMSDMASMMMVEGVMSDQAKVETMLATVNNAVSVTEASAPTQQKLDVLEVSIDTIGRLSQLGNVSATMVASSIASVATGSDSDPKLMTAAIKCIDATITDSASVSALEDAGCIEVVKNALVASAADPKLASAAKLSMAHLSKVAIASEASMAPATMAKILDAQAGDSDGLIVMVDELADLGAVALLECMATNPSNGLKVEAAATKSIARATNNGAVEVNAITQGQMRGIVSNMRRAQKAKSDKAQEHRALVASGQSPDSGGSVYSGAASDLVDNSMDLLALVVGDESQAISMANEGGMEELLAVLESKESTGVQKKKAAQVLKNLAEHNNTTLCSKMVALQISSKIAAALRDVEDRDFANDALTLLQSITSTAGAEEAGLDEEDLKIISVAVENQKDISVGEKGATLLDSLSGVYKAENADAITAKVEKAAKNLSSLEQYEEMQTDDGRTYYVNRSDNTTSWEMPKEMATATKQFQKIAELGETHADNMVEVDQKSVETCVQALSKLANKPTAVSTVCDALSRLVNNESNAKTIANADGIKAIVQAVRANPNVVALLISAFRLLNQFAKNDHWKKIVAAEGGIALVIHAMTYHYQHNVLMKLCLSVVANMAFNSAVNITALVKAGAIDCIERVMQNYEDEGSILELCMVALSNLMHNNDEVRITVGQTCGDEVVHIIRRLYKDPALVKSAMRAIGNLSFCDKNIRYLVSEHATEVVVKSMGEHPDDTELLQLAIDVIGNLASLDIDDDDDEETERIHAEVYDTIFREGGPMKILEILRTRKETSLLLSGMDSLSNIANDQSSVEKLLSKGLVELVLESMQANDWDEELSECTVKLLASISVAEECAEEITQNNGVQLLLTAMEAHDDQPEFLIPAHIAMSNIVIVEEAKNAVMQMKGIPMFCKQLEEFSDNEELAEKIIETLVRLSADDDASAELASTGMITFVDLIDQYNDDVDMLTLIFMFLGHLAFVTENLKAMVASGAVKKIVAQTRSHPDELELMVKAVQTLDNIAMANSEYADIVVNEGGKAAIEDLSFLHADKKDDDDDGEELNDACTSALLSMEALQRHGTTGGASGANPNFKRMVAINMSEMGGASKSSSTEAEDKIEMEKLQAKLAKYRNTLVGGKVVTVQGDRGGKKKMHILFTKDLRTFMFKSPMERGNAGHTIKIDDIRRVDFGCIVKKKSKTKPGEGRFYVECVQAVRSIDIVTDTQKIADDWVDAMESLVLISKKYRQLLPDK